MTVDGSATGGGARGRWAGTSGLTAPELLDEHFPSLSGGSAPQTVNIKPKESIVGYRKTKQPTKPDSLKKQGSRAEQFPALGAAASTLSDFKTKNSTPTYRNITGHQPAWQPSTSSSNENVPTAQHTNQDNQQTQGQTSGPFQGNSTSGMITLSKKSGKTPAPMPEGIDDFPGLEATGKSTLVSDNNNGLSNSVSQKKKKKKNKNGTFVGDLISAPSGMFNIGTFSV